MIAWFNIALPQCVCQSVSAAVSTAEPYISSPVGDYCFDCGHSRSCCSAQTHQAGAISVDTITLSPMVPFVHLNERPLTYSCNQETVFDFCKRGPPTAASASLLVQKTLFTI